MAVTKIIKIKNSPIKAIDYVRNPNKTDGKLYVSYAGCDAANIDICFLLANENKLKQTSTDGILAYHFIQSFAPTDQVSPEMAHEIGMKFMEKTFDDKYSFICTTHIDKGHIHNHFIMCASEKAMTGRKLNDDLSLLHTIQKNSDMLCKEYGLSVLDKKKGKGKSYEEWLADKESPIGSNKTKLRKLIDKTIVESTNFEDFIKRIKSQGVEIGTGTSKKYGTVTKFKFPEEKNFHRGYSLGSFYTDDNIRKRIKRRQDYLKFQKEKDEQRKASLKAKKDAMTKGEKALDKGSLKIKSMRDASDLSKDKIGLSKWTNRQNAMRMQQIDKELHEKFGCSYTELQGQIKSLRANANFLEEQIEKKRKELSDLRTFIENCVLYKKLHIYEINEQKADDKEKYYEEHEELLNAFQDAKFALISRGINLVAVNSANIKTLQKRLEIAEEENKNLEKQREQNEQDLYELNKYQKEIEVYLGRELDGI